MTLYDMTAVDTLAKKYIERGGNVHVIQDGSLLDYGLAIFTADGCKATVVRERYLNEWSSAYTLRMYNKLPEKYKKMIV